MGEKTSQLITLGAEETYPEELKQKLTQSRSLLESWYARERYLDELEDKDSLESILRENEFAEAKISLTYEELPSLLVPHSVRCVHYTRLLRSESKDILFNGMRPTTTTLLEKKLKSAEDGGFLSNKDVAFLKAESTLYRRVGPRPKEVCLVTQPIAHADAGIKPLLSSWGGEMVHFGLRDDTLQRKIKSIGTPAIVEVSLDLSDGKVRNNRIADCLVNLEISKFAEWSEAGIAELHVDRALSKDEVLNIHLEGSEVYEKMSLGGWP